MDVSSLLFCGVGRNGWLVSTSYSLRIFNLDVQQCNSELGDDIK
jgi:hypothetical protein